MKEGRWTDDEHRLFLQGLEQHGKDWKKIATLIKSRTVVQIRTRGHQYFEKLEVAKDSRARIEKFKRERASQTLESSNKLQQQLPRQEAATKPENDEEQRLFQEDVRARIEKFKRERGYSTASAPTSRDS